MPATGASGRGPAHLTGRRVVRRATIEGEVPVSVDGRYSIARFKFAEQNEKLPPPSKKIRIDPSRQTRRDASLSTSSIVEGAVMRGNA
ncbi:MAG: hypothetical protein E5Y86_16725 [Mesorhizobium sp.]|nr:MAG: hypothetical protein E5Y86_16725 [Mesorhizobium sp.]